MSSVEEAEAEAEGRRTAARRGGRSSEPLAEPYATETDRTFDSMEEGVPPAAFEEDGRGAGRPRDRRSRAAASRSYAA